MKRLSDLVDEYVEKTKTGNPEDVSLTEAIDHAVKYLQIEAEKLTVATKMAVAMGRDAPARARTDAINRRRLLASIEQLKKLQRSLHHADGPQ